MGYSYSNTRYTINGAIDTSKSVLDNLTSLCNAAGTWLTYDIHEGKWSVIINQAGESTISFDDSNIIGPININGTGLYNLYNTVSITYPHEDLKGQRDFISIEVAEQDRNANEPDNQLNLTYDIVTNPVQAQMLGFIELKQSRVDMIITFRTDHSMIHVKAGDLIDITSDVYGFDQKMFRVITVREVDDSDDSINIEITGLEYADDVYDTTNLNRYIRSDSTGIIPIGAIQAPNQPTVTKYEVSSRPRIDISTTMNIGIADTMEFWITYDVPPTVTVDANRTYKLLTTARPANGTNFSPNETVTVSFDSLSSSSFYIQARARNSNAVSPFSSKSGLIEYVPKQTTQAIDADTDVTGGLLKGLALTTLLTALADSYDGSTGNIGGGNAAINSFTLSANAISNGFTTIRSGNGVTLDITGNLGGSGGGSGSSGSTFLLLKIQNQYLQSSILQADSAALSAIGFNSYSEFKANIAASDYIPTGDGSLALIDWLYGDKLSIFARIIPPAGITPVIENANQDYLNQFVQAGYDTPENSTAVDPEAEWFPISWPPFYFHKMIYYFRDSLYGPWDRKNIGDVIAVDLGVYQAYYPGATTLDVEIRGRWNEIPKFVANASVYTPTTVLSSSAATGNLSALGQGGAISRTQYTSFPQAEIDSIWGSAYGYPRFGKGDGTPIRVRAQIYTSATNIASTPSPQTGNVIYDVPFIVGNLFANGVGYSSNVTISSSVNTLSAGLTTTSAGNLITKFHYDFDLANVDVTTAASFSSSDSSSFASNVLVPYTWSWIKNGGNVITGIQPNVTISIPQTLNRANIVGWTIEQFSNSWDVTQWYYSPTETGVALAPMTSNVVVIGSAEAPYVVGNTIGPTVETNSIGFTFPDRTVTQDDIDNQRLVFTTGYIPVNSNNTVLSETATHKFVQNILTEMTTGGNLTYWPQGNVRYTGGLTHAPDHSHLRSFPTSYVGFGMFSGNSAVPTKLIGNVAHPSAPLNSLSGTWVDGTVN